MAFASTASTATFITMSFLQRHQLHLGRIQQIPRLLLNRLRRPLLRSQRTLRATTTTTNMRQLLRVKERARTRRRYLRRTRKFSCLASPLNLTRRTTMLRPLRAAHRLLEEEEEAPPQIQTCSLKRRMTKIRTLTKNGLSCSGGDRYPYTTINNFTVSKQTTKLHCF